MKAVFDTKPNSGYDDAFDQYHFPTRGNYMAAALAARGDWIVLREPQRNGGRRAYVAVAKVLDIGPDPLRSDHAYAKLGDYLLFDAPVPSSGLRRRLNGKGDPDGFHPRFATIRPSF